MKTKLFLCASLAFFLLSLNFTHTAYGQIEAVSRPYEPIILDGSSFVGLSQQQVPIDELFLFAYNRDTGEWRQIPMQIDEVDSSGSFFGETDGLLDDNDQLVFMARDAGDRAPYNVWLDNSEARVHPRYEIRITDPMAPDRSGWLYLYRSSTLSRNGMPGYMTHIPSADADFPAADTIRGETYKLAHHAETGLPDFLSVLNADGTETPDLIDRLKVRIQSKLFFVTLNITEANFYAIATRVKAGPVRIIREVENEVRLDTAVFDTARVLLKLYPNGIILSGHLRFSAALGLSLVRVSLDMNPDIEGLTFFNPKNGPVAVDASPDSVDESILIDPELNWDMITGETGTVIKLMRMNLDSVQNATPALYYFDAPGGTGDGTPDTGDQVSFGDVGIKLSGTNITGLFPILIATFFLPGSTTPEMATQLRDQVADPLQAALLQQTYDHVPPARITDLLIYDATPTELLLHWTAPGDDGIQGGAASRYVLYLSSQAPEGDTLKWQQEARRLTEGLPTPAAPGTREEYRITGLEAGKPYYLALTAVDDFGNESPLSNVVSNLTVPVKLAAFTATAVNNEVHLSWRTASGVPVYGFAVERYRMPSGQWEEVGFVPSENSKGTVSGRYSFIDRVKQPGTYAYRLRQTDPDGSVTYSSEVYVSVQVPKYAELQANYPNPFISGESTVLRYRLPVRRNNHVVLAVYNILGQKLVTLFEGPQEAGFYELEWDGRLSSGTMVPPGIYFIVLIAESQQLVRKIAVLSR